MSKMTQLAFLPILFASAQSAAYSVDNPVTSVGDYSVQSVHFELEDIYVGGSQQSARTIIFEPNKQISISDMDVYEAGVGDSLQLSYSVSNRKYCQPIQGNSSDCQTISIAQANIIKSKDGKFDKPVYFVSGLNVSANGVNSGVYDLEKYWSTFKLKDVFKTLLDAGKDIVFIGYNTHSEYVENAVGQLIHYVETRHKQGDYHSTMVGYSYGGIMGRKALNRFEDSTYQHEFANYISIDAPHKGAIIPPSFIHAVERIKSRLDDVNKLCSTTLNSACNVDKERKQMGALLADMTEGAAKNLLVTGDNSYTYFNDLDAQGLPSTYNVAFSNGSYTGTSQGLPLGTEMAKFENDYKAYGKREYTLQIQDLSSSSTSPNYKAPFYYRNYVLENAPGSYAIDGNMVNSFLRKPDGTVKDNVTILHTNLLSSNKAPTFITTDSALALDVNDADVAYDLSSVATPFDKVYAVNGKNLSHTDFTYHKYSLLYQINKKEIDTAVTVITSTMLLK
ncbi:hypothetical protein [Pseudoalteromonas luteoviolacea]|uniref:alpha/beta hydrolase n=1 Tax=Pseudoalteromonas luteoviolacea TaxID=43657 RepID=UPI001B38B7A3|nr:hypothetical protein [Pseudoalteromonas luteoviolacea]MBQ4837869.1 hypothetical protein [Pseudoalteromonas luteoviolacea]